MKNISLITTKVEINVMLDITDHEGYYMMFSHL